MARKAFSSFITLLLIPSICHGLVVETCEELQAAFELSSTQDVEIELEPYRDIECETFTNMTMSSNTVTVTSSSSGVLRRVRLEVINGAKLFWNAPAIFEGFGAEEENIVSGGAVFVGKGSTVRFMNDLTMTDVKIISQRDGDFSAFLTHGGCVWTAGYFRVDGKATFTRCDIGGAGEDPPGNGGAIYVAKTGSVLFNLGVDISETYITDDGGGAGGGIYNLGKVIVKGDSRFEELASSNGGAIFNGKGAAFTFKNQASAVFRSLSNRDGAGGALFNSGVCKFSGPALFMDVDTPVIVAKDDSTTVLSEDSVFWRTEDFPSEALSVSDDADFTLPSSVVFVGFD